MAAAAPAGQGRGARSGADVGAGARKGTWSGRCAHRGWQARAASVRVVGVEGVGSGEVGRRQAVSGWRMGGGRHRTVSGQGAASATTTRGAAWRRRGRMGAVGQIFRSMGLYSHSFHPGS